jgi:hypothetical protein
MKEESAHNKASQSDPSRGLSNNMNNKPGHLLLWKAQIKVFHTKNLLASRQKTRHCCEEIN